MTTEFGVKHDDPDQELAELMRLAGERKTPDPQKKRDSQRLLREVWQTEVTQRKRRNWSLRMMPIAAATVFAIGLSILDFPSSTPGDIAIAEVVKSSGAAGLADQELLPDALYPGDLLVTQTGGSMTVQLGKSTVIIMDESTQATLTNEREIWLHHGRVYIDSSGSTPAITVVTALGRMRDIGTQFEVSLSDEKLELAMREGGVVLDLPDDNAQITATASNEVGDVITVNSALAVASSEVNTSADRWNWTNEGVPSYPAGPSNLVTIVEWIARQTGRIVVYDVPLTELRMASEMVSWPELEVETIEQEIEKLSSTIDYTLEFAVNEIRVSAIR